MITLDRLVGLKNMRYVEEINMDDATITDIYQWEFIFNPRDYLFKKSVIGNQPEVVSQGNNGELTL